METKALSELRIAERAYIDGLRAFADFLEKKPDLIPISKFNPYILCDTAEEFALFVRKLGRGEKQANDTAMRVNRMFGPHMLTIYISREQVCTKVKVGTRKVLKEVPTYTTQEVEEDVYEYECKPVLSLPQVTVTE